MFSLNLNRIFLLFIGVIIYGSLYPFDFTGAAQEAHILNVLFHFDAVTLCWGDIISNVILFIPYGFLGMAVAIRHPRISRQFAAISLAGAALAFGLQCVQVYLPTRFPSFLDALCNVLGLFLGGLLYLPLRALTWPGTSTFTRVECIACALIGAWFLDNLWPLIPAVDVQTLKEGLKPLFLHPPTSPSKVAITAIGWMLIIHLWEYVQKKPPRLIWLIEAAAIMFSLEILMEGNALQWEEVLGAILAIIVWHLWIKHFRGRKEALAVLLIGLLAWKGLSPFIWLDTPSAFHWMPFGTSIMGEPLYQTSVMIQKVFLYGCLAWLLVERRTQLSWSLGISVGTLMGIEMAQQYIVGHTPEITDPGLAFSLVLLINNAFQTQQASQNQSSKSLPAPQVSITSFPRSN